MSEGLEGTQVTTKIARQRLHHGHWRALQRALVAVAVIVGAAGIVACGSSSSGSSATKASDSKPPIKIFVYGDYTYPAPEAPEPQTLDIPQAEVKAINAAGGINGAQVEMTFCDSKLNPNTTLGCIRQATSGGYAAILDPLSQAGAGAADELLAKSNIPDIMYLPGSDQLKAQNAIAASPGYALQTVAPATMAKAEGIHSIAIVVVNLPGITAGLPATKAAFKNAGVQVTSTQEVPVTTTDLSAVWAQVMGTHPQAVYYLNAEPVLSSGSKQFLQTYPNTKLMLPLVQSSTLSAIGADSAGNVLDPTFFEGFGSGAPGLNEFTDVMKKYAKDPSADLHDEFIGFWLTVKLFAAVAETVKGPVTAASLMNAFETAKNVSLGGIVPNYSGSLRGQFGAPVEWDRWFVPSVVKNGRIVSLQGPQVFTDIGTGKLFNVQAG